MHYLLPHPCNKSSLSMICLHRLVTCIKHGCPPFIIFFIFHLLAIVVQNYGQRLVIGLSNFIMHVLCLRIFLRWLSSLEVRSIQTCLF